MNIKTSDLKKFKDLSSHIVGNSILPIYQYIKFGGGKIIKNVNSEFIEFDCADANEDAVVEERIIYSLLSETSSSFINIKLGKKITISDTKDSLTCERKDVSEYPEMPNSFGNEIELSGTFVESLRMALNFASYVKSMDQYRYVYVKESSIWAGDGLIAYHRPIPDQVELMIDKKHAQLLSAQQLKKYRPSDKHNVFIGEGVVYGFAKTSDGFFDFRPFFQYKKDELCLVDCADLTSFNRISVKISPTSSVTIEDKKWSMLDNSTDKSQERPVPEFTIKEPFTFNPERMNTLMDAFDCETIKLSQPIGNKNFLYVTSDDVQGEAVLAKIQK